LACSALKVKESVMVVLIHNSSSNNNNNNNNNNYYYCCYYYYYYYYYYYCNYFYRGVDKSLARPGRKQVTATEDFDIHISYLLS
jgi:restriction endonuclease S subunit